MKKNEALSLLAGAPRSHIPSHVNPALTQSQFVSIVETSVSGMSRETLDDLIEKRVWQAVKNQKRPRY